MAVKGNNFSSTSDPLNDRSVSGKPVSEARDAVFKKPSGTMFVNPGFQGQGKLSNQNVSQFNATKGA